MPGQNSEEKVKQARRCVACGETVCKRQLLRVVRTTEGTVRYDATGRTNGRGAYVCANDSCIEKAQKKKLFVANLKADTDELLYEDLKMAAHNDKR